MSSFYVLIVMCLALCVIFKFSNVTLTLKITIHVCNHLWSTEFYANYMVGNKERREADPGEEI